MKNPVISRIRNLAAILTLVTSISGCASSYCTVLDEGNSSEHAYQGSSRASGEEAEFEHRVRDNGYNYSPKPDISFPISF